MLDLFSTRASHLVATVSGNPRALPARGARRPRRRILFEGVKSSPSPRSPSSARASLRVPAAPSSPPARSTSWPRWPPSDRATYHGIRWRPDKRLRAGGVRARRDRRSRVWRRLACRKDTPVNWIVLAQTTTSEDDAFGGVKDFFESPAWFLIRNVAIFFVVLFWLASAFWVYKDARRRIEDTCSWRWPSRWASSRPSSGRFSTCSSGRPSTSRTSASASSRSRRWRRRLDGSERCPVCRAEVDDSFLVCPVCTTKLKQACRRCKAPLEPLWQVCPYCETRSRLRPNPSWRRGLWLSLPAPSARWQAEWPTTLVLVKPDAVRGGSPARSSRASRRRAST